MMILRYTQLHRFHHALFSVFSFSPLGFGTLDAGVAWPGPPRSKCLSSKDRRVTCWKVTASVPPANTWPNRHAEGSFAACQSAQENRAKASDLTSGNTWFDGKSTTVDLSIKKNLPVLWLSQRKTACPDLTWRFQCVIFPSREPTRRLSSAACIGIQQSGKKNRRGTTEHSLIDQIPTLDGWTTIFHHVGWFQTPSFVADPHH